jgi:hypothetical protein
VLSPTSPANETDAAGRIARLHIAAARRRCGGRADPGDPAQGVIATLSTPSRGERRESVDDVHQAAHTSAVAWTSRHDPVIAEARHERVEQQGELRAGWMAL